MVSEKIFHNVYRWTTSDNNRHGHKYVYLMQPKIFTGHVYIKEDNSTFSKFLLLKNEKNNNKQVQYKKAISNISVLSDSLIL